MGKRGPAPKGEYAGKSKVLSTRIRPDTRAALVKASKKSNRSLSQEIEHRLRRSFDEETRIADMFFDRRTFLLMRMSALALERAWNPDKEGDWLEDAFTFDQALKILNAVLEAIRPQGEIPKLSDPGLEIAKDLVPPQVSAELWKLVQDADPSSPMTKGTRMQYLARIIKTDLGPDIVTRPRVFYGNAAEFRAYEENCDRTRNRSHSNQARNSPLLAINRRNGDHADERAHSRALTGAVGNYSRPARARYG
jgi:hypothetical protein